MALTDVTTNITVVRWKNSKVVNVILTPRKTSFQSMKWFCHKVWKWVEFQQLNIINAYKWSWSYGSNNSCICNQLVIKKWWCCLIRFAVHLVVDNGFLLYVLRNRHSAEKKVRCPRLQRDEADVYLWAYWKEEPKRSVLCGSSRSIHQLPQDFQ